jgi:hypothetical protein
VIPIPRVKTVGIDQSNASTIRTRRLASFELQGVEGGFSVFATTTKRAKYVIMDTLHYDICFAINDYN